MWLRLCTGCLILLSLYHSTYFGEYFQFLGDLFKNDIAPGKNLIYTSKGYLVGGVGKDLFDCSPVLLEESVGEGWQKRVYRSGDRAVKKIRPDGPAFLECSSLKEEVICRRELLQTMVDEIVWLHRLRENTGIVRLYSYCIPLDVCQNLLSVRIVVELGEPLTSLHLVQQNWAQRKEIVELIINTIKSLNNYTMNDLRRQQFILVNGHPKLSDLDHLMDFAQNETTVLEKLKREFLIFLSTSDAPLWFSRGIRNVTSITGLSALLRGDFSE